VTRALAAGLWLALPLAAQGDELGRKVFMQIAQPPCMACHTLKAAGAEGTVGPSLDEVKPGLEQALQAIRNGTGIMPAFRDALNAEQINAVARFVVESAGK
jgi:mono/diheme cytochrome c family protein